MTTVQPDNTNSETLFEIQQGTQGHALIEKLDGPCGAAYRWNHHEDTDGPMSIDRWLISLPELNGRGLDDDESPDTGVFVLNATLSDHEFWARFKGVLPRFDHAYQIHLSEAYEPGADASDPESAYDIGDPLLGDYGDDLALLPHLLRVWAEELVAGRLHPYQMAVGCETPEQSRAYFSSLIIRAKTARQGANHA